MAFEVLAAFFGVDAAAVGAATLGTVVLGAAAFAFVVDGLAATGAFVVCVALVAFAALEDVAPALEELVEALEDAVEDDDAASVGAALCGSMGRFEES